MDLKGSLTKKIGPLPAVAWVGILAAIYVVYRYYQASRSKLPATNQPVVTAQGDIGSAGNFTSGYGGTGGTAQGSSIVTPTVSGPATNVDWGNNAANGAIAMGYNPTDVETAVGSYLYSTGQSLNTSQSAILRWILDKFGTPPQSVIIPPPTTQPPNVTPTPTPSTPTGPSAEQVALARQWNSFHEGGTARPAGPDMSIQQAGQILQQDVNTRYPQFARPVSNEG